MYIYVYMVSVENSKNEYILRRCVISIVFQGGIYFCKLECVCGDSWVDDVGGDDDAICGDRDDGQIA